MIPGCAVLGVAVVGIGLFVLMPATFLLTASGFVRYPPLDRGWFFLRGALAAIPVYALLALPRCRRWFAGLSRQQTDRLADAPRVVARLLLALTFVISPLVLANALVLVNGALDESPELRHETIVLEKTSSGGGRSAVSYSLRVQGWQAGAAWHDVGVDRATFDAARVSGPLLITTRSGRLGREWVASCLNGLGHEASSTTGIRASGKVEHQDLGLVRAEQGQLPLRGDRGAVARSQGHAVHRD